MSIEWVCNRPDRLLTEAPAMCDAMVAVDGAEKR